MCFLVNFSEFLRLIFSQNISGLLLLEGQIEKDQFINDLLKSLKNLANKCWSTVPPATSAEDFSKGISPSFQTIKIKNELVQVNINDNVGNSVVSADRNKENVNNQLELVRKYQHKKYQSRSGLNYDTEVNTSGNTHPDQLNAENNHRWSSGRCVIVGNSIFPCIDERCLSKKNRLVNQLSNKGFHLNQRGKERLTLNFLQQLKQNLMVYRALKTLRRIYTCRQLWKWEFQRWNRL